MTIESPLSSSAASARKASDAPFGSVTGGMTCKMSSRASKWRAISAAVCPARRDASEKSVAKRTLRMISGVVISGSGASLDDQDRAPRVTQHFL